MPESKHSFLVKDNFFNDDMLGHWTLRPEVSRLESSSLGGSWKVSGARPMGDEEGGSKSVASTNRKPQN